MSGVIAGGHENKSFVNTYRKGVLVGNWSENRFSSTGILFPQRTPHFSTTMRDTYTPKSGGFEPYRRNLLLGSNFAPLKEPSIGAVERLSQKQFNTDYNIEESPSHVLFMNDGVTVPEIPTRTISRSRHSLLKNEERLNTVAGEQTPFRPSTSGRLVAAPSVPLTPRPATTVSNVKRGAMTVTMRDFKPPPTSCFHRNKFIAGKPTLSGLPTQFVAQPPVHVKSEAPKLPTIRDIAIDRASTADRNLINSIGKGAHTSHALYMRRHNASYVYPMSKATI